MPCVHQNFLQQRNVDIAPSSPRSTSASGEDLCNTFRFKDLVLDIQIYIISYFVPPQDLKSLSLVSRYISTLAVPALYTHIRLVFGSRPASVRSPKRFYSATDTLVSSQQTFSFQFLTNLERARHVRTLAWQFLSNSGLTLTGLFPLLSNLRSVHLIDPHPTRVTDLTLIIPPLFPRINDVRLTGTTALSFVMPMLHSPHNLTSLSFDVIQPHNAALELLQWVKTTQLPYLKYFSLRALAQAAQNTQHWDIFKDNEIFSSWADALFAVHLSVEYITLGFRTQYHIISAELPTSPSAARFELAIMPVFRQREKWSKLKMLRLEGIDIDAVALVSHGVPVSVDREVHAVPRIWDPDPPSRS